MEISNAKEIADNKKYPKYYGTMVFSMTLTGLWKSATDRRLNKTIYFTFLGLNIFGIVGAIGCLFEGDKSNDVYILFEILIYIPLHIISIVTYVHLKRQKPFIDNLFDVVEKGYDNFNDSTCEKSRKSREKADEDNRFLIRAVAFVIGMAHFTKSLSSGAWNPFSEVKKDFIPLTLYFYRSNSLLFYYIWYMVEFSVSCAAATLNVLDVAVCVGLLNIVSSEIEALKVSFEDPTFLVLENTNTEHTDIQQHETNYYERLKIQIDQHNKLISSLKSLEIVTGPVAFILFVFSEFIVCFCTFQIYKLYTEVAEPDMPIIMNRIGLFGGLMSQQFVYFVAGQRLETKSKELHTYLYYSQWYMRSPKYKSAMEIMFERTKRPFILMAGNLIPLNLSSFVTCMQATYSYFSLLRAMS